MSDLLPSPRRCAATSSLAVACALAAGVAWSAALVAQQQPPTFTEVLDVDLVNVDVVVTDKNGNVITDLTREDFQITDDGKKVAVDYFARLGAGDPATAPGTAVPASDPPAGSAGAGRVDPLHLVLFVDLDNLMPHSRKRVLDDLEAQLPAYGEDLRVMVASYGPKGLDVELPFSSSPAEWKAALDALDERVGRGVARQAEQRRLVESIEKVLALAEGGGAPSGGALARNPLEEARSRLDELLGSARMVSESVRMEAVDTLRAIQTLASVLSIVPGQKSLLYVGDGVPLRPGQDINELLAEVFERDRRFAQSVGGGGSSPGGPPAPASPGEDSDGPGAVGGSGGFGGTMPEMSTSPSTLRLDAMSLDLTPELRALTATANSQRVTIYGLSTDAPGMTARADVNMGARTSGGVMMTYDTTRAQLFEQSLHLMAGDTGGLALPPNASVPAFLDRMVADREQRYSLAYLSPHGGDAKYHKIKVKVSRKGARLRHREGYIDRPRNVKAGDVVAGALLLGAGENPHRLHMELLSQEPGSGDEMAVSLGLRIPIDELQLVPAGDNQETKLELYILSKDGEGAFAPLRFVEVTVAIPSARIAEAEGQFYGATLPIVLEKGPQSVAVGIVEPSAQRTSVVTADFEVGGDG